MKKFLINKMALVVLFMTAFVGLHGQNLYLGGGAGSPIPTTGTSGLAEFTVTVTESGIIGTDVKIDQLAIELTHTWFSDLDVRVIAPDGTALNLWNDLCSLNDDADVTLQDGAAALACGASTPVLAGTFEPDGGTFANAFAGVEVNGTWTLEINDDTGGDSGAMTAWSMTVGEITCSIECPQDIVVNNDPGSCGANITVPAAITNGCDPVFATETITTGNQPLVWSANNTLDNTPVTLSGAVASIDDVVLDVKFNGDFGWSTERFQLRGPDASILILVFGASPDCQDGQLFYTVPQATWNDWVTTYGSDLIFKLNFDVDVNNFCANAFLNVSASMATGTFAYLNNYNNTDDASDYYPVGTTVVTFDAGVVNCAVNITVNDMEGPTFDPCPADIVVDLNPGECAELVNYEVAATDNCGDLAVSGNANLEWPTAVDFPFVCSNASADEITYFRLLNSGNFGLNVDGALESVDLGVWLMDQGTEMHIDVYELPIGVAPSFNNMTFLGSTTYVAATTHNAEIINIPVGIDVSAGARVAIGARATGTQFAGASVGFDLAGETGNTWVFGCAATFPPLSNDLVNLNQYNSRGLILQANFGAPGVAIEQTDNSGLTAGDEFPIGTTVQEWTGTDLNGFVNTCTFNVTVNEFANATSVMSCNDNVQVSLPASGVAVVGADMILEGGPYGCYDDYIVSIDGGGNTVDCSNVGETLQVLVADDNSSNFCWGTVTVEDKIDPIIECSDFTVDCNYDISDLEEGTVVTKNVSNDSGAQPSYDASSITLDFEVNGGPSAVVNVVTTDINISHTWVSDLNISITSPSGTTATVFSGQCGTGDDVDAFFADANANTLACNGTPVISGDIQPQSPFAAFIGESASGTWTMTVADNAGGDPTNINNINLTVNYSATYAGPVVTEACEHNVTFEEVSSTDDCSGDVGAIERTYIVEDASGNTASCLQTITIARPSMGDLVLPSSYDDQDLASLDCTGDSWDLNEDGYPNVEETGVPTLNGEPFFNGGPCGFTASYEDLEIDLACESAFKVRRQWIIIDWCTGEEVEYNQYIKVLDTTGPAIDCPADMVIDVTSGNPFNPDYQFCSGNVVVPAVGVSADDCSGLGEAETQLWSADGTVLLDVINTNGGMFADVEIASDNPASNFNAQYTVRHVVYDNCGNATTCEYFITTVDKVAPTAICIEVTTTSLNTQGLAVVPAEDFDNGSYDNCGDVYFYVLRNDEFTLPNGVMLPQAAWKFDTAVEFDCEDVDGDFMVTLLVLDFEPSASFFDNNGLLNGWALNTPVFAGGYNMCMVQITVEDKTNPYMNCIDNQSIDCDVYYTDFAPALDAGDWSVLDVFGTAVYGDNCAYTETYDVATDVDQCGEGTIERTWTVTDASGNGPALCKQTISIFHVSDWTVSFPADFDQPVNADCNYEDIDFGSPVISNDACEMIAVSPSDTQFDVPGQDACFKIFREWTVINWCTYDAVNSTEQVATLANFDYDLTGSDFMTYTQVIKVKDDVAPTVSTEAYTTQVSATSCFATFAQSGIDAISIEDGCDTDAYVITVNYGGLEAYLFNGNFVDVPAGEYTVTFAVSDPCGNVGTAIKTVTVEEKAPTAFCTDELVIDLMTTGMAEVNAVDFDFASSDNCTSAADLSFAFSSDINNTVMTVTCDELGANAVEMWVFDADGLTDFCAVTLTVQNNNGADCGTGSLVVSGAINTENTDAVADVEVEINGGLFATSTDNDGLFTFDLTQGGDYTVAPSYDEGIENGVTTFDIVKITQHILGIQELNSAYKVIAADANNSASVTTLDIVSIRKVILQIDESFPNNTSWRFVDAAYTFADAMNPWGFAEVVNFNNLDSDALTTDFVAVKVGDVTGDAQTSFGSAQDRTMNGVFGINAKEVAMTAGNTYDVTFTADAAVEGFQFTMNFDAKKVAFVGMTDGVATAKNFGFTKLNEGAITASWNAEAAYDFAGTEVFTVSFTALADVNLSDAVSINSRFTAAEAYAAGDLQDVALTFSGAAANNYALYQNTPNPFKGETVIAFELAQAGEAVVTIMDVNGKVVRTINGDFAKGFNNVTVKDINTTGVLYYTLESGDFTATKKMIIIE